MSLRCLVGIDDTDSARGFCTTYLAYRLAQDLPPDVTVIPYPRLVRLNPNIPFKTRGNAAVCLLVETRDPDLAFQLISSRVATLSDVDGGANSGLVMLDDPSKSARFESLYAEALAGVVSPHRVRRLLKENQVRMMELGNGMGLVGAASALGFDERSDHTFELIAYRKKEYWGTRRTIDPSSVVDMDRRTFPHTFNNYDYQKKKVLIAPHGPDPVFAGVRGDSPSAVAAAFRTLNYSESLAGYMVYATNQHTDAHLRFPLPWKVYSSGWLEGTVSGVQVGEGGHVYIELGAKRLNRLVAAYEPTADLRRTAKLLRPGDKIRAYGSVRRATSLHPTVLNLEKFDVLSLASVESGLRPGTYIASPRANRHLTKPLSRYGVGTGKPAPQAEDWLSPAPTQQRVLVRSR
jgi:tRNA(Ile2)-agmatinylcytidine synthase